MLRFGPEAGPIAVVALPLFEEANRTRAFAVTLCRLLAKRGVASVLPDLPGQGESLVPLETLSILDMQSAYDGLIAVPDREGRRSYGVGLRSGTLLDALGLLFGRWHFAPQDGSDLLRELTRVKQAETGRVQPLGEGWYFDGMLPEDAPDPPVTIAGNRLSTSLLTELTVKTPFDEPGIPRRVVRLDTDPKPADRHVPRHPALAAGRAGQRPCPRRTARRRHRRLDRRMRRVIPFACAGETLLGTLDTADSGPRGKTGLLIVSGGNEIRIGAHRGMTLLALKLAARGIPVFRFDRRGVGDSTGINGGFLSSGPDIGCAAATFSAETGIERLVAFGNCDAATALALFGGAAGIDRLLLANPWVIEDTDDLPPAAAIRARYAEKLRDPREWLRLARGGVDLRKLAGGLAKVAHTKPEQAGGLADRLRNALDARAIPAMILLAARDNTAIAFRDIWQGGEMLTCDTDSHSFAREADAAWLEARIVEVIEGS